MKILFPGRFQPFHNIHLLLLKKMLEEPTNKVIILIGSSDLIDENNPFTAKERFEMIKAVVEGEKLDDEKIKFVFLPDEPSDEAWMKKVLELGEKFEVVFSNNDRVLFQMKKHGIETISTGIIDENISATIIRKLIRENGEWKKLVPKSIWNFIEVRQQAIRKKNK